MLRVHYYPGCTLKASAPHYEASAQAVLAALDVTLEELPNWNCCGVVQPLNHDQLVRHVAPVRVLDQVQQQGDNAVLTLCDMCYQVLAHANLHMQQEPQHGKTIRAFLGHDNLNNEPVTVLHLLSLLRDQVGLDAIRQRVQHPLSGLRILPYYGCKVLRPQALRIDAAETPTVLHDLLAALGATVITDPAQTQCCGGAHVVTRDALVSGRVATITSRARALGAHAIALTCPLCQFNLDARQAGKTADTALPVLYLTQLMGLAFGLEPQALGLEAHRIDPRPLLEQQGLIQGLIEEGVSNG
jgi:heterodisulfide reductase subunit B